MMSATYSIADVAKGILSLILFFAAMGLVAQIFFGQIGQIAQQFPVDQSNPYYNAYTSVRDALITAMNNTAPLMTLIVAVIALGLVWLLVRILT
ncbi:MAG: hypothetical protein QXY83_03655 [Thermosphaera sp.]